MAQATHQTTLAAIKNYPDAVGYNDEAIQQSINDTWQKVLTDQLPDSVSERGHRLLVLHDLLMHSIASSGGVSSASTKDYTQTNFDWSKDDPYLIDYNRLVSQFGKGKWSIDVF